MRFKAAIDCCEEREGRVKDKVEFGARAKTRIEARKRWGAGATNESAELVPAGGRDRRPPTDPVPVTTDRGRLSPLKTLELE